MVDVAKNGKTATGRVAYASGKVVVGRKVIELLSSTKGPVMTTAEIAGIMGAKKTSELIPLCHNIDLSSVRVECEVDDTSDSIIIKSSVFCFGKTGVEMEALTAVSIAALTVYDMCKAVTKSATIQNIQLEFKSGGKSGDYIRDQSPDP